MVVEVVPDLDMRIAKQSRTPMRDPEVYLPYFVILSTLAIDMVNFIR